MKLEGLDSGLFRNFEGDATSCLHFFVEGANSTNLNGATYTGDTYSNMAGNSTSTEGYRDDIGPADASSKLRANNALTPRAYKPAAVGAIRSSNLLKHWYLSLVLLLSCGPACSQRFFFDHVATADKACQAGEDRLAIAHYDSAFARYPGSPKERVAFATVLKRSGLERRAVEQLKVAIDQHMHSYADKLFDSQWTQWLDPTLFEGFKRYADSTVAAHLFGYSEEFSSRLLSMAVVDQGIRKLIGVLEDSGTVPDSTLSLCWRQLDPIDSVNAADYLKLYSRHGFPDIDVVGEDANKAGWLILQHAPLAIQEQFLPIFRNSCERGQTPWQYYAYLTDRVMNRQGLPATKYGCSFIREPDGIYYQRVEDKACVNAYREAVGMPPLDGCRQFQNGEPCTP